MGFKALIETGGVRSIEIFMSRTRLIGVGLVLMIFAKIGLKTYQFYSHRTNRAVCKLTADVECNNILKALKQVSKVAIFVLFFLQVLPK